MPGNKAYLLDYEDFNGGFVAFGSHPKGGKITGKENQVNVDAGTQDSYVAGSSGKDKGPTQEYILLLLQPYRIRIPVEDVAPAAHGKPFESSPKDNDVQDSEDSISNTSITKLSTGRSSVSTATTPYVSAAGTSTAYDDANVGAVADFNNMDDTINVSHIPTLKIHKNHPKDQILGDPKLAVQTRGNIQKASSAQQALVSYISKKNRTNHKDHQNCLLACFLSKKKAIGTKWVFKNKRDKRSIVVKNKARLIAHGFRQEEGIDCDEKIGQKEIIEEKMDVKGVCIQTREEICQIYSNCTHRSSF
ncbi:putative ribonuclease H-like domain-containing protein [Tanacetum coccineum]